MYAVLNVYYLHPVFNSALNISHCNFTGPVDKFYTHDSRKSLITVCFLQQNNTQSSHFLGHLSHLQNMLMQLRRDINWNQPFWHVSMWYHGFIFMMNKTNLRYRIIYIKNFKSHTLHYFDTNYGQYCYHVLKISFSLICNLYLTPI